MSPASPRSAVLQHVPRATGLSAVLVGAVVLAGWLFEVPTLKSLHPAWVSMKVNTAIGLAVAGLCLGLLSAEGARRRLLLLRRAGASAVALLGLLTLSQYLFGWDLGIDEWLFMDSLAAVETSVPGRMAPATAFNFLLLGVALLSLDWETGRGRRPCEYLALAGGFSACLALLGYAYGARPLYKLSHYTSMALHTGLTLALLWLGVLCTRPGRGLIAEITAPSTGGALARRLLPAAVSVPVVLGWLRLKADRAGYYATGYGVALFVVLAVVIFTVLIWRTAVSLNRADRERRRAEEEIRQLNRELAEQSRRATEVSRLKSEFLANMSHELRTPLNAIIGFAELMHDGKVGPVSPHHKEFLGDILTSSRHLLQLINDVLDLAKVESGRMEFRPETVDLVKLVGEVRDILRTQAARKRIAVETRIDPAVGPLVLDPGKLKQALYNFLSNALKFTPEEGRVTVRAAPEGADEFRLQVEDTGVGIRPEDQDRLFVEFQQLEPGMTKRHQGTGLGLALTKRIVEAQGGRVGMRSAPGRGSVFFAVLPRVAAARPEAAPEAGAERRARGLAAPRAGAPRLLLVEDDAADREWLRRTLSEAGYAVETAASGGEALALARERSFDAVTLDLLLPDMSGWDVLRGLRAEGLNAEAPVIVVTVVAEKGASAGFRIDDFLVKPVQAEELLAALRRAGVPPGGTASVLVVDDDVQVLKLMEATLAQLGCRPLCAAEGAEGLRLAERERPAAVILDLLMPGMDGFEFLARFRGTAAGRRTPVIVWTVKDLTAEDRRLLKSLAQQVVLKGQGGLAALIEELKAYVPVPAPGGGAERP